MKINKIIILSLGIVLALVLCLILLRSKSSLSPPNFEQVSMTCESIGKSQELSSKITQKLDNFLSVKTSLRSEVDFLLNGAYVCQFKDQIYYAVALEDFQTSLKKSLDETVRFEGQDMTVIQACQNPVTKRLIEHIFNSYLFVSQNYVITINPLKIDNQLAVYNLVQLQLEFENKNLNYSNFDLCKFAL